MWSAARVVLVAVTERGARAARLHGSALQLRNRFSPVDRYVHLEGLESNSWGWHDGDSSATGGEGDKIAGLAERLGLKDEKQLERGYDRANAVLLDALQGWEVGEVALCDAARLMAACGEVGKVRFVRDTLSRRGGAGADTLLGERFAEHLLDGVAIGHDAATMVEVFRDVAREGAASLSPPVLCALFRGLGQLNAGRELQQLVGELERRRLGNDSSQVELRGALCQRQVQAALLGACVDLGDADSAWATYEKLRERSTATGGVDRGLEALVLRAVCRAGDLHRADILWTDSKERAAGSRHFFATGDEDAVGAYVVLLTERGAAERALNVVKHSWDPSRCPVDVLVPLVEALVAAGHEADVYPLLRRRELDGGDELAVLRATAQGLVRSGRTHEALALLRRSDLPGAKDVHRSVTEAAQRSSG